MPPNLDSPEVLGTRKRTLSAKVTSNGDPAVNRPKKKSKNAATAAPTNKQPSTTATAAKATPSVAKQLSAMTASAKKTAAPKVTGNPAQRRLSVEDKLDDNNSDHDTSENVYGSENDLDIDGNLTSKPISIDSDEDEEANEEKAPDTPEESAEAELSMSLDSGIRE
jgi:hypothetical protein